VLNVRVNLLEGPAGTVQRCTKLVQLNLADNALTGPLVSALRGATASCILDPAALAGACGNMQGQQGSSGGCCT
jgi:hypothetical protein